MSDDKSRQRLGRGLASLIGGGSSTGVSPRAGAAFPAPLGGGRIEPAPAGGGEREAPVDHLAPNPRNPRRHFGAADLAELTSSIRVHGVVQPILVRPKPGESDRFEIVAGERRWRAAREAGLARVPIVLRDVGDRESLEIAIIENVQRADLNAIEEALGYEMLIDEHGYTQGDLADILGKSRSHVANTLRLLKLPEGVREMVERGELSAGAARTLVSAADPEGIARRIVREGLSVREAEMLARGEDAGEASPSPLSSERKRASAGKGPGSSSKDSDTQALERLLSDTLELRVEIAIVGEGGSLRLDFENLDQLDEICRLLQAHRTERDEAEPRIRSL